MNTVFEHIPKAAHSKVKEYLNHTDLQVLIKDKRVTKHGDYRLLPNGNSLITVNNNLNPQQFLLTLVHELAHYETYKKFGSVKPHGKEWKYAFKKLMLPFLHPTVYSESILPHLAKYLINPKASTDSDVNLSLALKQRDSNSDKKLIFELSFGQKFLVKNRRFQLLEKRRTRFLCLDLDTQKKYLINQNTEVTPN